MVKKIKKTLERLNILPVLRKGRHFALLVVNPGYRRQYRDHTVRERPLREEFESFKEKYGSGLSASLLIKRPGIRRKALLVSSDVAGGTTNELFLIKALQMAGYEPVVITGANPWVPKYYRLAGLKQILRWEAPEQAEWLHTADRLLQEVHSADDLKLITHRGVRAGKYTLSTSIRYLRQGALDLEAADTRQDVRRRLISSFHATDSSYRIVDAVKPHLAVSIDVGYTPRGELYDVCLAKGIDTVTWNSAHKNNLLMLKRFSLRNDGTHPSSLSEESWESLRKLGWNSALSRRVQQEIEANYLSGDWYSAVGTQFHTRPATPDSIRRQLGLTPGKKTAIIFPHLFWDATLFWGTDLFQNYEKWFIAAVRAACQNDQLNWVIKVHPANVVKSARDGYAGELNEMRAIRENFGTLPPHVTVIPPESDISTFSLFLLMDYCLTVRGTIGVEAACFGVNVVTAGTGRYDHKGFTVDSESREEYIARLGRLQEISPMSPERRELAEKFAYGLFVLRPLRLSTISYGFARDAKATAISSLNAVTKEQWAAAPDVQALADWIQSAKEDYIMTEAAAFPSSVETPQANGAIDSPFMEGAGVTSSL